MKTKSPSTDFLLDEFKERLEPDQLMKHFKSKNNSKKIRVLKNGQRLNALNDFLQDWFFFPVKLIKIYNAIFSVLYRSYRARHKSGIINLLNRTIKWFDDAKQNKTSPPRYDSIAVPGFSIVGISGVGKTTSVIKILTTCFQQIIQREGGAQLTYVMTNCTHDSSLRGLLVQFISKVDLCLTSDYTKKYVKRDFNVHMLEAAIANICIRHHIGAWIIDEIHNLNSIQRQSQDQIVNFLKNINSIIGLPIIYIGTPDMLRIMSKKFEIGRKSQGIGTVVIEAFQDESEEWESLLKAIWNHQVLRKPGKLTKQLKQFYFAKSQGIIDIVVAITILAQEEALEEGYETLNIELLESAYKRLPFTARGIRALASGEENVLKDFPDLSIKALDFIHQVFEDETLTEMEIVSKVLKQGFSEEEISLIIKALVSEYPETVKQLKNHYNGKKKPKKSGRKKR